MTRVRFYETGVAWFEREGSVGVDPTLPLPASHLDDALKSLVVLGGDDELAAISFPTAVATDAARVEAGLEDGDQIRYRDALQALVGAGVSAVTAEGEVRGTLLDVEGPLPVATPAEGESTSPNPQLPHFSLALLDDRGTLHRLSTHEVRSVRAEDPAHTERLAHAAGTLVANHAQRTKGLQLQLPKGRAVSLGYVAEAPVWRVSYRIRSRSGRDGAELAGWALIHNTTSEAWEGVQVELANGEPDSFLYPLAAPRYAERELRTPDRLLATVPQLADATVDELWKVERGLHEVYGSGSGSVGYGMGGGGSAMGVVGHGVVGTARPSVPEVQTPTQFVYVVDRPVDLPAHHSALVPMVRADLPLERAVVFAAGSSTARSGVWVDNTTDKTLPAGVVSVLHDGGLEGEARLRRLKPTETQMVEVGNELDVALARESEERPEELSNLRYRGDRLWVDHVQTTAHGFTVRNRSGRPRNVWVSVRGGGRLEGAERVERDRSTGNTWVVFADVPAGEVAREVASTRRRATSWGFDEVLVSDWEAWGGLGLLPEDLAQRAASRRRELDRLGDRRRAVQADRARAREQLDGLQQSLAAAEDDAGPLTRQASAVERELRRLTERDEALQQEASAVREALREALEEGMAPAVSEP